MVGIQLVTEAYWTFDEMHLLQELILSFEDADRVVRREPLYNLEAVHSTAAHRGESSGHRHAEPKRTQPVVRIGAVIILPAKRAEPPVILTTNTLLVTDRTPEGASPRSLLNTFGRFKGIWSRG